MSEFTFEQLEFARKEIARPLEDEITRLRAEVERLTRERDAQKRRGDNHWETLRSIREFAKQRDHERIILWVNDAGQGYTESSEKTLGAISDELTSAKSRAEAAERKLAMAVEVIKIARQTIQRASWALTEQCKVILKGKAWGQSDIDRLDATLAELEKADG